MAIDIPADPTAGVPNPVRINTDDGPWSVSVAENPHDTSSFSVYVKTPTHLLTLTRTSKEISDLHAKLRETHPNTPLPPLPEIIPSSAKRRSSFLHTLSRLGSKEKHNTSSTKSTGSSLMSTPLVSPSKEAHDPFSADADPGGNVGALPSYLTTLANHPIFRNTRPWRRFVHVRVDDLESVRVERTIKRVRSDLVVHSTRVDSMPPQLPPIGTGNDGSIEDSLMDTDLDRLSLAAVSLRKGTTIQEMDEDDPASVASDVPVDVDVPTSSSVAHQVPAEVENTSSSITNATTFTVDTYVNTSVLSSSDEITAPPSTAPTSPDLNTPKPEEIKAAQEEFEAVTPVQPNPNHPHSRVSRSASVDPSTRHTSSTASADVARRRSWKKPSSPLNPSPRSAVLDTDAEQGFDTDIEHPSASGLGTPLKRKKRPSKKVTVNDFEMMRVLGKGCAGKVLLVKHRASSSLYALKAITKRHVLAHQELQHTLTEQAVLKRMSRESQDPFVVKLWWSFHDKENLFLVMDFHPGGDLATQLARWGRLGRDRARFYAAEIVEGVEGLHAAGVIYRDLKPENILIGADGHIVLTDFGLSKEFPRPHVTPSPANATAPGTPSGAVLPRWMSNEQLDTWRNGSTSKDYTGTFCGTAEYLAPEVIQGLQYSYEVDWWSFGTMLYEMLSGITPFWANNHSDMYVRVLQDELHFPEDKAMDQDTKSLIRGLLQRNPALRMREPRIKKHPYFSMIDWAHVYYKRYIPPYIPPIDPQNASDTQNFDDAFLDMSPTIEDEPDTVTDSEREKPGDETTDTEASSSKRTPAGSVASSVTGGRPGTPTPALVVEEDTVDVFDGYSFKGRQSVIIDDDEYDAEDADSDVGADDASIPADDTTDVADDESDVSIKASIQPRPSHEEREPRTPVEVRDRLPSDLRPPSIIDLALTIPLPPSPVEERGPVVDIPEGVAVTPSEVSTPLTETPVVPKAEATPIAVEATPVPSVPTRPPPPVPKAGGRARREKSGIAALDKPRASLDEERDIPKAVDHEEDDWDFVETPGGEEANGPNKPSSSLFARGVVDRYRLAVFRKTPTQKSRGPTRIPLDEQRTPVTDDVAASPSPSEGKRRGRTTGINLRKSTNKFLRAKSPPSAFSPTPKRNLISSPSNGTSVTAGLSTPSRKSATRSGGPLISLPEPSLKSKSSGLSRNSIGTPESSEPSVNGEAPPTLSQSASEMAASVKGDGTLKASKSDDPDKLGKNFNKKMKVGAEKVMSLFGSPRPS